MANKFKNLTGQRFGMLTVLWMSKTRTKGGKLQWTCKCDCGNIVNVVTNSLRDGSTKSCGCLRARNIKIQNKKARENGKLPPLKEKTPTQTEYNGDDYWMFGENNEIKRLKKMFF